MHLNAKPPIFVPPEHRAEVEKLSKAALMDMVWDYAMQIAGAPHHEDQSVIGEFRNRREIILEYRKTLAHLAV